MRTLAIMWLADHLRVSSGNPGLLWIGLGPFRLGTFHNAAAKTDRWLTYDVNFRGLELSWTAHSRYLLFRPFWRFRDF